MTRTADVVPSPGGSVLARPRLDGRLDDVLERRLTTLVADAGFGKSTLIAGWASRVPTAWYTLDHDDAALSGLARGVVEALARHCPPLSPELVAATRGQRGPQPDEDARADAVASVLCQELEATLQAPLLLVLDDLHALGPSGPAVRFVEGVVRHAPPMLHLVLASRAEPPFPIERLRSQGHVLSLDASALAFSPEETGSALATALGDDARGLAPALHASSGGWPAAVRLLIEALRDVPQARREAILASLTASAEPVLGYLAEEVFAAVAAPVRELVRVTALFDRFDVELCQALGLDDVEPILADLRARGLFVQDAGGGWSKLHELIRRFALERMPLGSEHARRVRRAAAHALQSRRLPEEALDALDPADDQALVQDLLERDGDAILSSGAVSAIIEAAEGLTPDSRRERVEALLGEAYMIAGDSLRALASFERSAAGAADLSPGLAWRMGLLRYARGELDEAVRTFARARPQASEARDSALLLAWSATTRWLRGELDECRTVVEEARTYAEASDDDAARAAVETVLAMLGSADGDAAAMEDHSRAALEAAERARDTLQVIRIRNNRASHAADAGRFSEALADLEVAIRMADVTGFAFFQAGSLSNRGHIRFLLGQLDLAQADFESARSTYRRLGSRSEAYALLGMGEVHRARGELVAARATLGAALDLSERSGDKQVLVLALARLATVLAADDPERAAELADRAIDPSLPLGRVEALLAAGWVARYRDDRAAATAIASEAATEAARRNDLAGSAEAEELLALADERPGQQLARLEQARAAWQRLGSALGEARNDFALGRLGRGPDAHSLAERALDRLRILGVSLPAAAAPAGFFSAIPSLAAPAVEIHTLGGFSVYRAGEAVRLAEWQSRKARDVLKMLIARRGRSVSREQLVEELWPDDGSTPDKLSARLSVQLAIVRAVLDPDHRSDPDKYIQGDATSVRLDPDALPVDVELFLRDGSEGLRLLGRAAGHAALPFLMAAEARYTGEFLEEDPYVDWSVPLREEARALYIAVVRSLGDLTERSGDLDAAVRYRLRLLQRDPYDEEAHLGLARALSAGRRHGEARRAYGIYASRMRELDVEASPFPASVEVP